MLVRFVENRVTLLRIVQIGDVKNNGRREFNVMVQRKRIQGCNYSSHSILGVHGKAPPVMSRVCSLN